MIRKPALARAAWALYDAALAPFTVLIVTFVFPAYFAKGVVGDVVRGQALWGYTLGAAGLLVALLAPLFGALADAGGRRKPWLALFTGLCAAGSAALWFARPAPAFALPAMIAAGGADVGFEFAFMFLNAMLGPLAAPGRLGRLSGWAWALGYVAGLSALVLVLAGFVQAGTPWLGLSRQGAQHIRIAGPIVAAWMIAFAWPLFLFTPDRPPRRGRIRDELTRPWKTLLSGDARLRRFIFARMLYADGLATLFSFGGLYAAGQFKMTIAEVMMFGILLNVTAGLGAFAFSPLDDRLGSRRTILLALSGLLITGIAILLIRDRLWFWAAGALLGIFVGPVQSASRSLMARLAPPGREAAFFGLFALSGRATAFLGPTLVGVLTALLHDLRAGVVVVVVFLGAGLWLMGKVKVTETMGASHEAA